MKFIDAKPGVAVQAIATRMTKELTTGKHVLWLVSGGSNVALQVQIMEKVLATIPDKVQNLTILPMDERYGAAGHIDSNTEFMRKSGFHCGNAEWIDVLAHDLPLEETLEQYTDIAAEAMADANIIIGQFGLGSDGHIAGTLPSSPATEEDYATVVGYEWTDYTRMTLSPRALLDVQLAYVLAYGENKQEALERLEKNKEEFSELPAKLLYEIPEVYVYNEYINSEG